ncbi:MAG: hypothetical protein KDN05_20345, partial [Verrucomicrobiae bacterium]|nr:hypothetical protein [Verrucomicrobiae bacterium]
MKPRRNLFLGTLVVIALSQSAFAATHYWDGASATWNDAVNWSTDSGADTPDPLAVTGITDDAIFNITTVDGNMVVTLDANQLANSLTFDNTGTTAIQANASDTTARSLTLAAGGITLNSGAGAVTLGGGSNGATNLVIDANQSWTNNSSSLLTVTAGLAINNALTIGGSGNATISGGAPSDLSRIWTGGGGVTKTGAGTLNITGNISSAQGRWTIGNGYGGNFTMEQGAMNLSGISYITLGDGSTANAIYNQMDGTVLLSPAEDSTTRGV